MKMAARWVSLLGAAVAGLCCNAAWADTAAPNSQPNPYHRIDNFFKMPPGRTMGSSSAVAVDHHGHIWVAERCGANSCANSKIDPIMEFDSSGNFIKAFGGGMMVFPHGFFIDKADHIWVTDAQVGDGKGDDVLEFDQNGKLLRTLGKPGIAGSGPDTFSEPSSVLVAPNGDIFVGDGHEEGKGNARIVKFDKHGVFLMQWGSHGSGPGQIEVPHTLAMDSRGRLFEGDRGNSRIQIFSQDGKLLDTWTQFSRPSGLYVDQNDVLYVTDSESRNAEGYGHHPGWTRGIRIGSTKDGVVTAFIPDPDRDAETKSTTGAEGITADGHGAVYGAEVGPKDVVKYEKK
ncbi:MAG: peptidyl-alpha-hydroxyglycine alpha-amidating lyase family protein [Steroidobacteraceae bacterium]